MSDLDWRYTTRPVTGGEGLRVSKMGKLQDKGKLGKFHVQECSYNVHASDCGSAHL